MKKIRNILFLFLVFLLTGCGAKTPEKLVCSSLEQIKKLDEKTIQNFVSYQDLVQNKTRDTDVGEETIEAVLLDSLHGNQRGYGDGHSGNQKSGC